MSLCPLLGPEERVNISNVVMPAPGPEERLMSVMSEPWAWAGGGEGGKVNVVNVREGEEREQ